MIIVRHGETLENARHVCQGQSHGTLSSRGVEEALLTGEALRHEPFVRCHTSDLGRAERTARLILSRHAGLPVPLVLDRRLRERYFGSFEGKVFPPYSQETVPLEEVEKAPAIARRLRSFLDEIVPMYGPGETVLILSHGFTLRVLMALLRGIDPETIADVRTPGNCSVTEVLAAAPGDFQILRSDDRTHLAALL